MRSVQIIATSLTAIAVAGCASMSVRSDYDPDTSLAGFQTYEWVEPGPSGAGAEARGADSGIGFDSPLMAERIRSSVRTTLAGRGFDRVASATPDFRISYRMVAREEVQQLSTGGPYGYGGFGHGGHGHRGFGHGGHGFGGGYGSTFTRDVVRCILVLDIWDPRSGRLLWRGWARWMMSGDPSPEKVTERLERAVGRILDEFPPEGAGGAAT